MIRTGKSFIKIDPNTRANTRAAITSSLKDLMTLVERRRSKDSDSLSTSNKEDAIELQTWIFGSNICRAFLEILNLHQKKLPSWDYVTGTKRGAHHPIIILDSIIGHARNDGAIVYADVDRLVLPFI